MNATEILADNLRRLKASDRLTDYRDTGWLEIALEGRGGSLNVFAIEHLASMLGVEPWQLLAPLCGRAEMEPPAESTEAADAARYRWLRDHNAQMISPNAYGYQVRWVSGLDLMHGPAQDTYDSAVDAAMAARK